MCAGERESEPRTSVFDFRFLFGRPWFLAALWAVACCSVAALWRPPLWYGVGMWAGLLAVDCLLEILTDLDTPRPGSWGPEDY